MENLPNCPKCNSEYTYEDGSLVVCPECGYEWNPNTQEEENVIKDVNGNVLNDGDSVTVVKDLKVKGASSSIKIGTKVKVKISKTGYESRTKTVTVKKAFTSNLTINSVKKTSTYVTGKGQSGATVRAYVNGKQIGKSATVKNGKYSIRIPKQSKGKKITVKMTKTNYITVSKTTTVK